MDLYTLLDICKKYQDLGWAIQEQLHAVALENEMEDQNPNALEYIAEFLEYIIDEAASEDDEELRDGATYHKDEIRNYLNNRNK